MNRRNVPHFQLPYHEPTNHLALSSYHYCLRNFERHIDKYIIRYHDLYCHQQRYEEADRLSEGAIQQAAEAAGCINHEGRVAAASRVLLDIYSRCQIPQKDSAIRDLLDWGDYLQHHRSKVRLPSQGELSYERRKNDAAEWSAQILWRAYEDYTQDPRAWVNNQIWEHQVMALNIANEASHQLWLMQNQPHRLPPPPLRPDADEFYPSAYPLQSDTANEQMPREQNPMSPTTVLQQEHSPLLSEIDSPFNVNGQTVQSPKLSHSEAREIEDEKIKAAFDKYQRDVLLLSASSSEQVLARALLDTGNHGPNVVSKALVHRLGLQGFIKQDIHRAYRMATNISESRDINGNPVMQLGIIELCWRFNLKHHTPWNWCTFNVVSTEQVQIVFGLPYLRENPKVLDSSEPIVAPLIPNVRAPKTGKLDRPEIVPDKDELAYTGDGHHSATPQHKYMTEQQALGVERSNRNREKVERATTNSSPASSTTSQGTNTSSNTSRSNGSLGTRADFSAFETVTPKKETWKFLKFGSHG